MLLNILDDGQIYVYNLKDLAERDIPYKACSESYLDGD